MHSQKCACSCGGIIPDRYPNGRKRSKSIRYIEGHSKSGLWWYEGKPHPDLGKKKPELSKKRLADGNPNWKGDDVSCPALHNWIRSRLPKLDLCSICSSKPPYDIANISPTYNPETYTRDLKNWRWLCRSCHMSDDNRLLNLKQFSRGLI